MVFWTQIGVGVAFSVLLLLVRQFTIRINATELTFGFGPFRKAIDLSKIVAAYADEASLASTGIGVHIVRGGYWAWIARPGTAVRVVLVVGGSAPGYIISTVRPRDLIAALTSTSVPRETPSDGRSGAPN